MTIALLFFVLLLTHSSFAEDNVHTNELTKVCVLSADNGVGDGAYIRWYFDRIAGLCTEFKFRGIGGNANNFQTIEQCQSSCPCPNVLVQDNCKMSFDARNSIGCKIPSKIECSPLNDRKVEVCLEPVDPGPCTPYIPRWFYNSTSGRCDRFLFGGCGGNENNFESRFSCSLMCRHWQSFPLTSTASAATAQQLEIRSTVVVKSDEITSKKIPFLCNQPKLIGPCSNKITRWYYNRESRTCEKFAYGGCDGNDNNFLSFRFCKSTCNLEADQHVEMNSGENAETVSTTTDKLQTSLSENTNQQTTTTIFSLKNDQITSTLAQFVPNQLTGSSSDIPFEYKSGLNLNHQNPPSTVPDSSKPYDDNSNKNAAFIRASQTFLGNLPNTDPPSVVVPLNGPARSTYKIKLPLNSQLFLLGQSNGTGKELNLETSTRTSFEKNRFGFVNVKVPKDTIYGNHLKTISSLLKFSSRFFTDLLVSNKSYDNNTISTTETVHRETILEKVTTTASSTTEKFLSETTTTTKTSEENSSISSTAHYDDTVKSEIREEKTDSTNYPSSAVSISQDACLLTEDFGGCNLNVTRYFFNKQRGRCERFVYGGCAGNENNFDSILLCRTICKDFLGTLYVKFPLPQFFAV